MPADQPYEVKFSKRKSLAITVERDGRLLVRAPIGTDRDTIERVLHTKRNWVRKKLLDPRKHLTSQAPGTEIVSGETLMYQGRGYRVEVIETASGGIELDVLFRIPASCAQPEILRHWYKKRAAESLLPRAQNWAERLGVKPAKVGISDARYRWGSCTPAGNILLNWRLVKAPVSVADYVIVHELAHLLENNHGERFWSILRSQLVRVDEGRAWLRDNGWMLEEGV